MNLWDGNNATLQLAFLFVKGYNNKVDLYIYILISKILAAALIFIISQRKIVMVIGQVHLVTDSIGIIRMNMG